MTGERLTFGHGAHVAVPARAAGDAATRAHEPPPVRLNRVDTWDWGWGGLLIFTILLFFRPQDQIPGLDNSHISDVAALIGLSAMVFLNVSRGQPITRLTPELAGMFALGAVILATVPTSFWMGGAFAQFRTLFVPLLLIFMLMVNTVTSPKRVERICWVIVLAFGYMSALVIINYARGVNLVEGNRAAGPVGGFFQNPNDLALNLAAFLPLVLMFVLRPGPALRRLVCAGISLLMVTALLLTKSRGGMLGAVAMVITFILVARLLTPALIIGLIMAGMVAVPLLPDSFWTRMASITDADQDQSGSRAERMLLLEQGWTVFLERPLTGVGMGQFQSYHRAGLRTRWHETHNVLLQVGSEIGIFGLAAFLFLIVRAFSAAWWTRKHLAWIGRKRTRGRREAKASAVEDGLTDDERRFLQTHGTAMVAAMVGWFVCAMFGSVAFNWTFYYLLGLSVTARDVVRARERAYAKARARTGRQTVAA
jgi:O-antigen ligase